ncbi:hypothetical protein GGI35DRAFT_44847 [Trichoderma velutinum]
MPESEAWTVVKTKSRRPRRGHGPGAGSKAPPSPSRAVPQLTKEEIQKDFENFNTQFKASPCAEALREIISTFVSDSVKDGNEKPITEAISLGIGSFDPPDGSWQLKRRAHTQLAAMLFMVNLLEEKTSSGPIKCIFQEPAFTPSDIAFLDTMSHKVVDSPVASDSVGSGTLFFGPHLYRDIYAMSLKGDLPAIWIGTGWDVWSDVVIGSSPKEEEPLLAIKKMDETYKNVPFPDDDKDSTIFYGTSIYLRHPEKKDIAAEEKETTAAVEETAATETKDAEEAKEAPSIDDTSDH